MERYLRIAAQYNVTEDEIGEAAAEAYHFTVDDESEAWYDVYTCALGNIDEAK